MKGKQYIEIGHNAFIYKGIKIWACPRAGESPLGVGLYARSPVPTLPDMRCTLSYPQGGYGSYPLRSLTRMCADCARRAQDHDLKG